MKKYIDDNQGIALVTSLMLTLISMTIIMALLYMMTASTQRSAANKRYRSALDASTGGAELVVKDVMPYLMNQFQSYTSSQVINNVTSDYTAVNMHTTTANCLKAKLYSKTADWTAACGAAGANFNPKSQTDVTMTLQSASNMPFNVYAKVVDTIIGNSDTSGSRLEDAGGVAYSGTGISPQHFPYVYRIEVQGERQANAVEKSSISVLYAY